MKKSTIISLLGLLVFEAAGLYAAIIPGRWDKINELSAGTPIVIGIKSGDTLINGAIIGTAIGFGTAFIGWIGLNDHAASVPWRDKEAAGYATGFRLAGALDGFLVGTGVDAAIRAIIPDKPPQKGDSSRHRHTGTVFFEAIIKI